MKNFISTLRRTVEIVEVMTVATAIAITTSSQHLAIHAASCSDIPGVPANEIADYIIKNYSVNASEVNADHAWSETAYSLQYGKFCLKFTAAQVAPGGYLDPEGATICVDSGSTTRICRQGTEVLIDDTFSDPITLDLRSLERPMGDPFVVTSSSDGGVARAAFTADYALLISVKDYLTEISNNSVTEIYEEINLDTLADEIITARDALSSIDAPEKSIDAGNGIELLIWQNPLNEFGNSCGACVEMLEANNNASVVFTIDRTGQVIARLCDNTEGAVIAERRSSRILTCPEKYEVYGDFDSEALAMAQAIKTIILS